MVVVYLITKKLVELVAEAALIIPSSFIDSLGTRFAKDAFSMIHGFDFLLKSNPNVSKRPNTILMSKMSNVSNIGTFSSKSMVTFTAPPETWRASSWVHIKPQCFSHHLDCYANAMQMLCIDYWFISFHCQTCQPLIILNERPLEFPHFTACHSAVRFPSVWLCLSRM